MSIAAFLREHADEVLARRSEGGARLPDAALRSVLLAVADALESRTEVASHLGQALSHTEEPLTLPELLEELCSLRAAVLETWTGTGDGAVAEAARFDRLFDHVLLDATVAFGQKLDDAMNRSLATIGHDLRNSLGAISMSSSLLARAPAVPEELRKPVGGIVSTVARMKHMVNDLEDLARVRLGKGMPIARASVDLQPLIAAAVKEIRDLNADFSIEFYCGGDLNGSWDGARVAQALANLVRHAVQYGSFREPIRASAEGLPGELVLSVANLGLPEPMHPLAGGGDAMQRHRTDEPDSRSGARGFRLGLYVAAAIAAAHGGRLEISSGADGTTLALRLPR